MRNSGSCVYDYASLSSDRIFSPMRYTGWYLLGTHSKGHAVHTLRKKLVMMTRFTEWLACHQFDSDLRVKIARLDKSKFTRLLLMKWVEDELNDFLKR